MPAAGRVRGSTGHSRAEPLYSVPFLTRANVSRVFRGVAASLRTETTINNTYDFGVGKRPAYDQGAPKGRQQGDGQGQKASRPVKIVIDPKARCLQSGRVQSKACGLRWGRF